MEQKDAGISVIKDYVFLEAHSFPRTMLSEDCEFRRTDNHQGQISEHISAPNGGHCLYIMKIPSLHLNGYFDKLLLLKKRSGYLLKLINVLQNNQIVRAAAS